jgi:hypothetical protein
MSDNLWEETNGVFEVSPGARVEATIDEAILRAGAEKRAIAFEFNGVTVTVRAGSDKALIYRDWHRALSGYIGKAVGPYPQPELSGTERAHDAEVEAQNEARRVASQAEYDAKQNAKQEAAEAKLRDAAPIELADADGWRAFVENNTDPYGGAVVTYAERWARLMQVRLAAGESLAAIADATSSEADIEGITGFMYGCAVATLAKTWKHGEELRRWHNLKTQIRDEGERANESGGVLNPALLSREQTSLSSVWADAETPLA